MQWKDVDRPTFTRITQPLTGYTMATVSLGYRWTAYDRLYASWKYWSVLRRTNIQVTRRHQAAETVTEVVT